MIMQALIYEKIRSMLYIIPFSEFMFIAIAVFNVEVVSQRKFRLSTKEHALHLMLLNSLRVC